MNEPKKKVSISKKNKKNERARMIFLASIFSLVFLALIVNVAFLAITGIHLVSGKDIKSSDYANGRGMEVVPLYAKRGNIYSSDNEQLSGNAITYDLVVYLSPKRTYWTYENNEQVEKPAYVSDPQLYAEKLAPILGCSSEDLVPLLTQQYYLEKYDIKDAYQSKLGIYGNSLTYAQKNRIQALGLVGLDFEEVTKRNYKFGTFAAHVLGYCQTIDKSTQITGASGVELAYNKLLSGTDGSEIDYYDSHGFRLTDGITNKKPAKDGADVYLTLNVNVQQEAEIYMQQLIEREDVNYVWAMVMEAHTGKILCMTSAPTFDLNTLQNISLNFNTDYAYECGSVVKPFIYATAMDQNQYPAEETYRSGNYNVNGVIINDWWRPGWGYISYREGLVRSSNVAICNLLDRYVSQDAIKETYKKLGYWESFDLDGIHVTEGVSNVDNSYVDYIMTGFGQSSTWTSFHLLRAYSVFANDGCIVEPYLVDYVMDTNTNDLKYKATTKKSEQIFTPETCKTIRETMIDVVNDGLKGTATQYMMGDLVLAGKSGTGQIWDQQLGYDSGIFNYTIAALAPAEDPQIVMVCGIQGADHVHHGMFAEMVQNLARASLSAIQGYGNVVSEGSKLEYTMPDFTNHTVDYIKYVLNYAGATPIIIGNGNTIVEQYPAKNETITTTSRVFVKTDGNVISIPNFTGWTRKEIATYAALANVKIICDGTGKAQAQSVPPGYQADANTQIVVSLS